MFSTDLCRPRPQNRQAKRGYVYNLLSFLITNHPLIHKTLIFCNLHLPYTRVLKKKVIIVHHWEWVWQIQIFIYFITRRNQLPIAKECTAGSSYVCIWLLSVNMATIYIIARVCLPILSRFRLYWRYSENAQYV